MTVERAAQEWAPGPETYRWAVRVMRPLQAYHRHHVAGMDRIPAVGRVLLVVHHTFATYDSFLLGLALTEFTGRVMRGLADDLIFRTPVVRSLGRDVGLVPASPGAGRRLLEREEMVGVAPGGMRETAPKVAQQRRGWPSARG